VGAEYAVSESHFFFFFLGGRGPFLGVLCFFFYLFFLGLFFLFVFFFCITLLDFLDISVESCFYIVTYNWYKRETGLAFEFFFWVWQWELPWASGMPGRNL